MIKWIQFHTSGNACLAINWSNLALLFGDISSSASASICAGDDKTGFGKVFFLGVVVVVDVEEEIDEDISLHQVCRRRGPIANIANFAICLHSTLHVI